MCARRLHVPGQAWNRRQVLTFGGSLLAAWPILGPIASAAYRRRIAVSDYPFALGVASGDPTPDGFVVWTRLAPNPLADDGGMKPENVQVRWKVAHDEKMSRVVAEGTAIATPELAHTVHVEVPGLENDRWYFYQFEATGEVSPVGRARTMPADNTLAKNLKFAFASCQHFETGYYTAYQHMAQENCDLVAHLGDYIYEYAGKEGRIRKHVGPHIDTLADYRIRHAQYRSDELLQAAHAMCPWLVTWDDHEFDNNYANLTPEHPKRDINKPELFVQRRANAYQAYYEHMPLRKAQLPVGPDMQLFRGVRFGRLADFSILDTRQYRTDQPLGDGLKTPTPEVMSSGGTLLGQQQEDWLVKRLEESSSVWNVLAQQVMMARVDRRAGETEAFSMDQWPGYEANRRRMLELFAKNSERNPVVLTGDIHCNWANHLTFDDQDATTPAVAVEFVGTSISSGGDGGQERPDTPSMLEENPCVKFFNNERGYVVCELTPETWTSHYRTVPFVSRPGAPLNTRASFVVENGVPQLNRV